MPKADATGLAPEKSAEQPPGPSLVPGVVFVRICFRIPFSLVKPRSGGLGLFNATTARRALQIRNGPPLFNYNCS